MSIKSTIESILFIQGESLTVSRLARITGAPKNEVLAALGELQSDYRERGIVLIQNGEEWQLATHPANKEIVEKFFTSEFSEEISRAGLEVVAIVAYKGPITRARLEYIRGVDSSFTLRNLLMRGLVSREENPEDRRSYLYRISSDFLKHVGLSRLEDLPHYEALRQKELEVTPGTGS